MPPWFATEVPPLGSARRVGIRPRRASLRSAREVSAVRIRGPIVLAANESHRSYEYETPEPCCHVHVEFSGLASLAGVMPNSRARKALNSFDPCSRRRREPSGYDNDVPDWSPRCPPSRATRRTDVARQVTWLTRSPSFNVRSICQGLQGVTATLASCSQPARWARERTMESSSRLRSRVSVFGLLCFSACAGGTTSVHRGGGQPNTACHDVDRVARRCDGPIDGQGRTLGPHGWTPTPP